MAKKSRKKTDAKLPVVVPKRPIQLKLMLIMTLVLIFTTGIIISLATYFFKKDNRVRIVEENIKITELTGLTVEEELKAIIKSSKQMALTMQETAVSARQKDFLTRVFFDAGTDLVFTGIYLWENDEFTLESSVQNREYVLDNKLGDYDLRKTIESNFEAIRETLKGKITIHNFSLGSKQPLLGLAIPFTKDLFSQKIIVSLLNPEKLSKLFQKRGLIETFLVGINGNVLAHHDPNTILKLFNMQKSPLVQKIRTDPIGNGQVTYTGIDGKQYIGAFKRIATANLAVISRVLEDKIFEEVYNIQKRNIYILIIAICISSAIVFLFAKSITQPILKLLRMTREIAKGNFSFTIAMKQNDEVGILNEYLKTMAKGLEEREKAKEALGRFVNPVIAELAMSDNLELGGKRKDAVVFFSDIRSFTAISEKLSPEEVVEFLNEYLSLMVECVDMTFGIIDKFIGDAIMATWGTTVVVGNVVENGVNAALMMRQSLLEFNEDRGTEKKPKIRIGCGLNYGPVVAGQIGSENRLEYTVIGDTVNLASRIEALNKPFGTDILITEEVLAEVEGIYNVQKMRAIKVKGKEAPQTIYAVIARFDDPDPAVPKTLEELRKKLGIEFDEEKFLSYDLEQEEEKYEIVNQANG
ncbi:MAG: adenylate/guanylate cyclase domain-containing protein [Spirochaetota bacterium]